MSKKKKEESKLPTVENTKQKLKIIIKQKLKIIIKQKLKIIIKQKIKNIIHVVRKLLQK